MGNLGNPRSIASCHLTKYWPSCKSCWSCNIFSENMGHPKPIQTVIIKKCPKLLRIYRMWAMSVLWANEVQATGNKLLAHQCLPVALYYWSPSCVPDDLSFLQVMVLDNRSTFILNNPNKNNKFKHYINILRCEWYIYHFYWKAFLSRSLSKILM